MVTGSLKFTRTHCAIVSEFNISVLLPSIRVLVLLVGHYHLQNIIFQGRINTICIQCYVRQHPPPPTITSSLLTLLLLSIILQMNPTIGTSSLNATQRLIKCDGIRNVISIDHYHCSLNPQDY